MAVFVVSYRAQQAPLIPSQSKLPAYFTGATWNTLGGMVCHLYLLC